MKRMGFATLAIFLLLVSATSPALANGTAHGEIVSVSVMGLPDWCPTGASMQGKLVVALADKTVTGPQLVTLEMTTETPFGDALVFTKSFRMKPGTTRSVALNLPVEAGAPIGTYVLHFTVMVKGAESVTVDHTVQVYNW